MKIFLTIDPNALNVAIAALLVALGITCFIVLKYRPFEVQFGSTEGINQQEDEDCISGSWSEQSFN